MSRSRRAVTLIESLVVIAVIAVLIGIALPALMRVRNKARETDRLAEFRSITAGFIQLAAQDDERWPVLTDPEGPVTISAPPGDAAGGASVEGVKYFDDIWYWHLALARPLLDLPWHHETFSRSTKATSLITDIWYSRAFYAEPAYFSFGGRSPTEVEQWVVQRVSDVRYPSDKSVLAEGPSADETGTRTNEPQTLSFVDGSAAWLAVEDIRAGYPPGVFGHPNATDFLVFGFPGVITLDGVHGRDR